VLNVLTPEIDRTHFSKPLKDNEQQRVDHMNEIQDADRQVCL
jgi:hypothetical protein